MALQAAPANGSKQSGIGNQAVAQVTQIAHVMALTWAALQQARAAAQLVARAFHPSLVPENNECRTQPVAHTIGTPRATTDITLSLLQVVKAMEADPHVNRKNLPVRTGRAFLDGFSVVASKSSTIGLPLLIMHSPTDKVCRLFGRL